MVASLTRTAIGSPPSGPSWQHLDLGAPRQSPAPANRCSSSAALNPWALSGHVDGLDMAAKTTLRQTQRACADRPSRKTGLFGHGTLKIQARLSINCDQSSSEVKLNRLGNSVA